MANTRILIVEDEVALEARPMEITLTKAGYKVIGIAETEIDAVKMACRDYPTIVIMDIGLPNKRGKKKDHFAGIRAAQKIQASTRANIIFVTNLGCDKQVIAKAQKVPNSQFLSKPVTKRQLLTSVQFGINRAYRNKGLIFVCYSHQDKHVVKEMMKHLNALKKLDIVSWTDDQIAPSRKWKKEIQNALAGAKAAICLVSPDFIASDFITKVELPLILKAENERGLYVYPVFVNFVDDMVLDRLGLLNFQGVNQPDNPIATWPSPKRHQYCWGILSKWLQLEFAKKS